MDKVGYNIQRSESREKIIGDVRWTFAWDISHSHFEGTLVDMSKSGLSIFTQRPVVEGDVLKISAAEQWEGFRYATVKWCREIAPDIYRIGLLYSSKPV